MRGNEEKLTHVHVVGVRLRCRKKGPLKVIALKVNEIQCSQIDLPRFLLQKGLELERVLWWKQTVLV